MKKVNEPIETVLYGETVIPANRLEFLQSACSKVLRETPGNILEVGVYKGGTLVALAECQKEICPEYNVYGIDTFIGHPYTDGHEVHPIGKYGDVDQTTLENYIDSKDLGEGTYLYEGKVEEIFEKIDISDISFLHVDCDLYTPIKYCIEHIAPLLKKGGMVYFDDYGHEHCPGATKAIEEFYSKDEINEVALDDGTCWSAFINV